MLKFVIASLFLGCVGIAPAQADVPDVQNENEIASMEQEVNQSSIQSESDSTIDQLLNPRRPGRGNYSVRWVDVNTGRNISGWVPSNSPTCYHGENCSCGRRQNYCGTYGDGQRALYWDRGCGRRPRTIACEVW